MALVDLGRLSPKLPSFLFTHMLSIHGISHPEVWLRTRTFSSRQPATTSPQPFHDLVVHHQRAETIVDNLDGRVWKPHNSSVDLPCVDTRFTFPRMLSLGR